LSKDAHSDNQHLVARLEAFSDIVIGFSLAQTTINLVVTTSVEYFFAHPIGILAYLITFFFVARTWWMHSDVMRHYFEPNRLMIVMNFVALAALGLMVFSMQLWMHRSGDEAGQLLAVKFWFICFAMTFGVVAVMRALGVHYRWSHLSPVQRRSAMGLSLGTILVSCAILVGIAIPSGHDAFGFRVAPIPANMLYALVFGALGSRLIRFAISRSHWGESESAHA